MNDTAEQQTKALTAPHTARALDERVRIGALELGTYECSCVACQGMCHRRPCFGTPDDIERIVDAGHAGKLMAEYGTTDPEVLFGGPTVWMVQPAVVGFEGKVAPDDPGGTCAFLNRAGRCELHDAGLKPSEGKIALCFEGHEELGIPFVSTPNILFEFTKLWNTERGLEVGRKWRKALDEGTQDETA